MSLGPVTPFTGMLCDNLGLSYTQACNARCSHCGVWSSPDARDKLGVEAAVNCIAEAASVGVGVVALTGGEPTFYLNDLLEIMRRTHDRFGTRFSMTSNGGWATSLARARTIVGGLAEAGLVHLRLSADAFHQQFVPLAHVTWAVEASLERGLRTRVDVVMSRMDREGAMIWRHFRKYNVVLGTQLLLRAGRASERFPESAFATTSAEAISGQGCIQAGQVLVDHRGDAWMCCNFDRERAQTAASRRASPFWIGSINEQPLSRILTQNEHSTICRVLRASGPAGLVRLLQSDVAPLSARATRRYSHICDLCKDLLTDPRLRERRGAVLAAPGEPGSSAIAPS